MMASQTALYHISLLTQKFWPWKLKVNTWITSYTVAQTRGHGLQYSLKQQFLTVNNLEHQCHFHSKIFWRVIRENLLCNYYETYLPFIQTNLTLEHFIPSWVSFWKWFLKIVSIILLCHFNLSLEKGVYNLFEIGSVYLKQRLKMWKVFRQRAMQTIVDQKSSLEHLAEVS